MLTSRNTAARHRARWLAQPCGGVGGALSPVRAVPKRVALARCVWCTVPAARLKVRPPTFPTTRTRLPSSLHPLAVFTSHPWVALCLGVRHLSSLWPFGCVAFGRARPTRAGTPGRRSLRSHTSAAASPAPSWACLRKRRRRRRRRGRRGRRHQAWKVRGSCWSLRLQRLASCGSRVSVQREPTSSD